jgi:hypothetical protein
MLDIENIKKKYAQYSETSKLDKNTAVYHIRILLEEVDNLKSELDKR